MVNKTNKTNEPFKIPGVRNRNNATTADVIAEQIALCKANLLSIEKIATFRKEREKRDEISRRLRGCHDCLGMAGSRKYGCLYREKGLKSNQKVVCEHAIPVTALVSLYQKGVSFERLVFYPVARISKESDMRFGKNGTVKSGYDETLDQTLDGTFDDAHIRPFLRYHSANILIETYEGVEVNCETWRMEDHWALIGKTKELVSIKNDVSQKLESWKRLHAF